MILGWKHQASFDPQLIAANPGGLNYMPQFTKGLDPNDRYILERNGFAIEAPPCYLLQAVQALIDAHGPLWVASAAPAPHIRVVTGYDAGAARWRCPAWAAPTAPGLPARARCGLSPAALLLLTGWIGTGSSVLAAPSAAGRTAR